MLGGHRFRDAPAGQRHLPTVRGEGAVQDVALMKGDELSHRDRQTTRPAVVGHVKRDDPIDLGEWEGCSSAAFTMLNSLQNVNRT